MSSTNCLSLVSPEIRTQDKGRGSTCEEISGSWKERQAVKQKEGQVVQGCVPDCTAAEEDELSLLWPPLRSLVARVWELLARRQSGEGAFMHPVPGSLGHLGGAGVDASSC